MPLTTGCSIDAFRANVAAEIRAGRPREQAVAIAHDKLREDCKAAGEPVPSMRLDELEDSLQVMRYDAGRFASPTRTPNGYLRCDARITKVGVFPYALADGRVRRELRLPDEVFRDDSLSTFEDTPLTHGHPPKRSLLTPKNTRRFASGLVKGVRRDGSHVAATVVITDGETIEAVENGKTQLSCGYRCDLEWKPGVTRGIEGVPDGLHYDAIQRNIIGNHVAIVDVGRAGADASLHLDRADAASVDIVQTKGKTMKVRIDGVEYELDETPAQAVAKVLTRLDAAEKAAADAEKKATEAKARADAADEAREKAEKERADSVSDDNVRELVRTRVALETKAAQVLADESVKLDEMSDVELKRAVVLKVSPEAKARLDGADDAYVDARYDAAVESWQREQDAKPKPAHSVRAAAATASSTRIDAASARQRMLETNYKMGRDPIRPTPTPEG